MNCPRCQHTTPPDAEFCPECGARLELACSQCGTANAPTHKFCKKCGQPLAAAGDRTPRRPAPTAPEAYTPRHLAEKILTSRAALEGERKQVTVLFADLKGSMELLADRDPEEARKLLDPVLERMMEAVHRYEGTVNQVMGYGIMALFGAPLAHEDHAVRACYAALRMQEAVKRYAEEIQRTEGTPISIRVGLNSGEVVVRSIGSDLHMDYTAVGQTTHLAARMEQMALPGSILITSATLALAEGYVGVKPLGPVNVKGLGEPIEAFELTGAGVARTRLQAAAARGLTRFVGRDAEVEAVRQALERARTGHGQLVALVGEPGVGKSRLAWEFTHSHRTHGWLVLESGSVSYGRATAYLPVIDLLKAYFQIDSRDDARKIREKLTGKLLTLDETLGPTLPAFLALLDVPVDDPAWQALEPPQRRQRTLDAVKRLLLRESQVQPLLVVFEDLHLIDGETQAFLDGLTESLPTARVLLLVNYRPEYEHHWGSKTYYTQVRLDPLPPESAQELLDALVGHDATAAPLKPLLIARTEGNPFFLEESVRTLVETGVLAGDRGAYRLARSPDAIQVPATVQAVLAARIDRLPPEDKRLLQSAAVIGKDVPLPLLLAIAERGEDELRRSLTHLQGAEFLYETSLFPDPEYTFKHALTHEVAYGGLLHERRRELHARIVEAIERLHAGRLAEQVERLAHHAFRGERWEKALAFLIRAAAKATALFAPREAVAYLDQALVALDRLPPSRETMEQGVDLRFSLRNVLVPLGEIERILDLLREAEALAERLEDRGRLARVSAYMTHGYWWTGDPDRAIDTGERALTLASELGDFGLEVMTNFHLGQAYVSSGRNRRAAELFKRNVDTLQGDLVRELFGLPALPAMMCRVWLAGSLARLGEFAEARASAEDALRVAEAVGHRGSLLMPRWSGGYLHVMQGRPRDGIPVLEQMLDACRSGGFRYLIPQVGTFLGEGYTLAGRATEAVTLLEEAAEVAESIKLVNALPLTLASLGQAQLEVGRPADAMRSAESALALARNHGQRATEAIALRLVGEIHASLDPPALEEAEAAYRGALALAEELGMRPLAARCHLDLGKLFRRVGKRQQAQEHLATAERMLSEMNMGLWLEQAEAELRALA